jgi:hypothetical protein
MEPVSPRTLQTAASFPGGASDANPSDSTALDSAQMDPSITLDRVDKVTLEGGFRDPDQQAPDFS